jgi:prepilin-type N-terminal cleavage/methylation domain-containing protein
MIRKFSQKAFTLIELMIVIVIIAIAIAIGLPKFMEYNEKHNTIKNDKQLEETIDLNKDQDSGSKL